MNVQKVAVPATTYATPGRALTALSKLGSIHGGKKVSYVISKTASGRFFPVFVDTIKSVSLKGESNIDEPARKVAARADVAKARKKLH